MLKRVCPKCNSEITYKSIEACKAAEDKRSGCRKCAAKDSSFLERYATKGKNAGKENAFFGKKHTDEAVLVMSNAAKARKGISKTGNVKNLIRGSVYKFWIEKYGEAHANKKLKLLKDKHSVNNSGKRNPMYGKPCPGGSGYGWKGWYKGCFFRSLRELSFMVENTGWKSAENIRVSYTYNGSERTYSPDFILNNRMIEVKPQRLHGIAIIQAKANAAKEYCQLIGMTYELIDQKIVEFEKLDGLVINKEVIWHDRYKQRYDDYKDSYLAKRASGVR